MCSQPEVRLSFAAWLSEAFGEMKDKAINDLALWLYVLKDEGLTVPTIIMGLVALATNLPRSRIGERLRVSFAYNAANHFIGTPLLWPHINACSLVPAP